MRRLFMLALAFATPAIAQTPEAIVNTRALMAETVTTPSIKAEYRAGVRDTQLAFKRVLAAYLKLHPAGEREALRAQISAKDLTLAQLTEKIIALETRIAILSAPPVVTPPPVPVPPVVVPPVVTPPVTVPPSDSVELAPIASNFDVASELVPSWGNGAIASTGAPDNVGAFRFICNPSHLSYDDPIVYPGQPGKAHLHEFFGNTKADAHSTYASLRTTGLSTCNSPLNRSAYWMPAMFNGKKKVVRPDYTSIYYKRHPASSPFCNPADPRFMGICVDIPRGLRFVFGHDMLAAGAQKTGAGYFNCQGPGSTPGNYLTLVKALKNCPAGAQLGAVISAPECWDGKNLDSPNHRTHVAYPSYGSIGINKCPSTHPYLIPTFSMGTWYTTDAEDDRTGIWSGTNDGKYHLSSDSMPGMADMMPGSTFHADWWGAWDDGVMKMWADNCINKLLSCSGGDLGNGKQLKMFAGFKWTTRPNIVDAPARLQ